MRWICLGVLLVLGGSHAASALDTAARIGADAAAKRVLAHNPIRVETRGQVSVPYANAVKMFSSPTLLADVQVEYARLLPPGQQPEFVITQTDSNGYFYVNRSGEQTVIRELHRGEHEGPITEVLFYAKGRRFFGEFEAVIHIGAVPENEGIGYTARVFAYPENSISRFFARHLRLVQLFFHRKTAEIETLAVRISQGLTRTDVASANFTPTK